MAEFQTDPKIVGPGTWYCIHVLGYYADNLKKAAEFVVNMENILSNFPCSKCKERSMIYFKRYPPHQYLNQRDNNGQLIGPFLWTWKFHNWVNSKLGKPSIPFENAINMYRDIIPCTKCGDSDEENSPITISKYRPISPTDNDPYKPMISFIKY